MRASTLYIGFRWNTTSSDAAIIIAASSQKMRASMVSPSAYQTQYTTTPAVTSRLMTARGSRHFQPNSISWS